MTRRGNLPIDLLSGFLVIKKELVNKVVRKTFEIQFS